MSNPEPYATRAGKVYRLTGTYSPGVFRAADEPAAGKRRMTAAGAAVAARNRLRVKRPRPDALEQHDRAEALGAKHELLEGAGLSGEQIASVLDDPPSRADLMPQAEYDAMQAQWEASPPIVDAFVHQHENGSFSVYAEIPGAAIAACASCGHRTLERGGEAVDVNGVHDAAE